MERIKQYRLTGRGVFRRWAITSYWSPEWGGLRWFNISAPALALYCPWGHVHLRLWELFNRHSTDGHFWGVGLLQINRRFLFGHFFSGTSILFFGRVP